MTAGLENKGSAKSAEYLHHQARLVWTAALFVVAAWAAAIITAPLLAAFGFNGISGPIYYFFSHLCHQMPGRSFHTLGHQFAVCSRCSGVYFGLLAAFLAYPLLRKMEEIEPLPRIWLFLALIPIGADWSLGIFGIWENTHLSRFITGLILGGACAVYIIPALVEIARNTRIGGVLARSFR
ncbi:MAG TPA: hypothetical protein DEA22_05095 [Blastocatellia bacterium]|nr:hypothetical protein [Blastocatellia bacterium]